MQLQKHLFRFRFTCVAESKLFVLLVLSWLTTIPQAFAAETSESSKPSHQTQCAVHLDRRSERLGRLFGWTSASADAQHGSLGGARHGVYQCALPITAVQSIADERVDWAEADYHWHLWLGTLVPNRARF